jgi:hypothetical protein
MRGNCDDAEVCHLSFLPENFNRCVAKPFTTSYSVFEYQSD